jgi:hypothetical protein
MGELSLFHDINGVHNADDGGIHRAVFTALRQAGGTALHDQNDFANAGADRINGNHMPFLVLALFVHKPRDEQFAPVQAFILSRGNNGSNDSCK